jgi:hypothetical protein
VISELNMESVWEKEIEGIFCFPKKKDFFLILSDQGLINIFRLKINDIVFMRKI